MIDPADPLEKKLLGQLRITSELAVAETIMLAPPGKILGKWSGPTSKEVLTQTLFAGMNAQKSCQIPNCGDPVCETPKDASAKGGVK
ncbi:MAG: hypothetical protein GY852_03760 [bacterium]|nr:hypothetical protein [bacterium]